jgi:cytochrome P450
MRERSQRILNWIKSQENWLSGQYVTPPNPEDHAATAHFGMAGVTKSGELRGCPLTGAEMQSADGGLLNMNPPQLRAYQQQINGLFTSSAAEATRPAIQALAASLAVSLGCRRTADALAGFAEPFTAAVACATMAVPMRDWARFLEFSRVAFAVVPRPAAISEVAQAWQELYGYYEPIVAAKRARPDGG